MDGDNDEVVKWKVIAAALHRGALDHCETFTSTEDAIRYLHNYQGCLQEEAATTSVRCHRGALNHHETFTSTEDAICYLQKYQECIQGEAEEEATTTARRCAATISRKHHDFYYHPDNLLGPVGLSVFFSHTIADRCVLCTRASVTLNTNRYKWTAAATDIVDSPVHATPPERSSIDELNLRRLEHLAVMHTPYFVMLFLELVQQKRYVFHEDNDAKSGIARHVFEQLKEDDSVAFGREHDSFKFLKSWWRFQDSESTRFLKISMPSYFELHTDNAIWTIRSDRFGKRQPEPLYTFMAKNCLCHELWLSGGGVPYSDKNISSSPTLRTVTRGEVSTWCLSVLVPKLHLEDILHSLVRVCEARKNDEQSLAGRLLDAAWKQTEEGCRSPLLLTPKLDGLVLEDVGHDRAVMMHIITTLDSRWQPLSSWIANTRGKPLQEPLVSTRNKVFLEVLGSLRDMCLQDKRPPRLLYGMGKAPRESKLAQAFFVHAETGDVLSLLPFVSLPRIQRSTNIASDEEKFRLACAQLALYIFWSHIECDQVILNKMKAKTDLWETHAASQVSTVDSGDWSEIANAFCRTGLVNAQLWYELVPEEFGSSVARKVDDVPHVWLGKDSRTIKVLTDSLLALGFREPLNVTVIELLREEEAHAIRESRHDFAACTPEHCRGLLSALTPSPTAEKHRTPSSSSVFSLSSVLFRNSSPSSSSSNHSITKGVRGNKRVNNIIPDVARKVFLQNDAAAECGVRPAKDLGSVDTGTTAAEGVYSSDTQQSYDGTAAGANMFTTHLNLTTHTVTFDDIHTPHTLREETSLSPRTTAKDVAAFFNSHTSGASNWSSSHSNNAFYTRTELLCDDVDMPSVLYNAFKDRYADNPDKLIGIIQAGLRTDDIRPIDLSHGHKVTRERENDKAVQAGTDMHPQPAKAPYKKKHLSMVQADAITQIPTAAASAAAQANGDRRSACENDTRILAANRHWKSSGFKSSEVETFGYKPYKRMVYLTCDRLSLADKREVKLPTSPADRKLPTDPRQGLAQPPCHLRGWARPMDSAPVSTATVGEGNAEIPQVPERSLENSTGSRGPNSIELFYHGSLNPKQKIPRVTLCSKEKIQTYKAVSLSRPPENGFRHVELIISDFPSLSKSDMPKTQLEIRSRQTVYSGVVVTIENVNGLLLQRIYGNSVKLLEDILALHTSLQVHPFVPRTFALHLMKTPFQHQSAAGVFVGEAAGEWNLGCTRGMMNAMTDTEKSLIAYHVLQCLLRVQILCLRVLGFTLKCIKPERIWRWQTGFRVDFISCLADTIHTWHNEDSAWRGAAGLATIQVAMQHLGLFQCLPDQVKDLVNSTRTVSKRHVKRRSCDLRCPNTQARVQSDRNGRDEHDDDDDNNDDNLKLYTLYNMCAFAEQPVSEESSLDVILGTDQYKQTHLLTMGLLVEPYGPFYIQIHNQYFKWNKAIIVEPVVNGPPRLAEVLRVLHEEERQKVKFLYARVHSSKKQASARATAAAGTRSPQSLESSPDTMPENACMMSQSSIYY